MKSDKEWEARARELRNNAMASYDSDLPERTLSAMLQLGREMAEEARNEQRRINDAYKDELLPVVRQRAADERAEEIARRMELACFGCLSCQADVQADTARLARSTITKQKDTILAEVQEMPGLDEAAIRADEREKIAQRIDTKNARAWVESKEPECDCAELVRGKPKTREAVLEEALRVLAHSSSASVSYVANAALEWKP